MCFSNNSESFFKERFITSYSSILFFFSLTSSNFIFNRFNSWILEWKPLILTSISLKRPEIFLFSKVKASIFLTLSTVSFSALFTKLLLCTGSTFCKQVGHISNLEILFFKLSLSEFLRLKELIWELISKFFSFNSYFSTLTVSISLFNLIISPSSNWTLANSLICSLILSINLVFPKIESFFVETINRVFSTSASNFLFSSICLVIDAFSSSILFLVSFLANNSFSTETKLYLLVSSSCSLEIISSLSLSKVAVIPSFILFSSLNLAKNNEVFSKIFLYLSIPKTCLRVLILVSGSCKIICFISSWGV